MPSNSGHSLFKRRVSKVSDATEHDTVVGTPLVFATRGEAEHYRDTHNSRSLKIEGYQYRIREDGDKFQVVKVRVGHFG